MGGPAGFKENVRGASAGMLHRGTAAAHELTDAVFALPVRLSQHSRDWRSVQGARRRAGSWVAITPAGRAKTEHPSECDAASCSASLTSRNDRRVSRRTTMCRRCTSCLRSFRESARARRDRCGTPPASLGSCSDAQLLRQRGCIRAAGEGLRRSHAPSARVKAVGQRADGPRDSARAARVVKCNSTYGEASLTFAF